MTAGMHRNIHAIARLFRRFEETSMKKTIALIAVAAGIPALAPPSMGNPFSVDRWTLAQAGAPSGRGATTGDPAASSATPGSSPTTGNAIKPNRSGSGTSTSGGRDDNGDQGRDKMPESDKTVRPNNKPDKM
jgi:hypothetical protein